MINIDTSAENMDGHILGERPNFAYFIAVMIAY